MIVATIVVLIGMVMTIVREASPTGIATISWALTSIATAMPPMMAMSIAKIIAKSLAATKIY